MSKKLLGRCLAVIAIICGVAVLPAIGMSLYVGYYMMMPRYSVVEDFDRLGFNLRLDLYLTDDEARDFGRYLSVINGGSSTTRSDSRAGTGRIARAPASIASTTGISRC